MDYPGVDHFSVVSLVSIAIATVNVMVMLGVSLVHPRESGPPIWALGNVIFAIGIATLTLRTPETQSYLFFCGNVAFVVGYVVFWWGCARFQQRPAPYRASLAIILLHLAPFSFFLFIEPNTVARIIVMATTLAIICAAISWMMLRRIEPGLLQSQALVGMIFGVLAVLYLLRSVAVATGALDVSDFGKGPLGSGVFILPAVGSLLATAACALMLTQRLQYRLQATVCSDALTGLLNRGLLDEIGAKEVSRARRHREPLSVLAFDTDFLGRINREHGVGAGDAALRHIAEIVSSNLRLEDHFGRLDGGTFCVIIPATPLQGSINLAERLRSRIASAPLRLDGNAAATVTASFGVSSLGLHGDDWASMLQRASMALDQAKAQGRNRIEVAALEERSFRRA